MERSFRNISAIFNYKKNYDKSINYLEKLFILQKEKKNQQRKFGSIILLYVNYKHIGRDFDENEIHNLIKKTEHLYWEDNFHLYQLLEDTSYLETAYNQVQEKADNLEPDVAAKFLSYPIPKAIVEEWEKVK